MRPGERARIRIERHDGAHEAAGLARAAALTRTDVDPMCLRVAGDRVPHIAAGAALGCREPAPALLPRCDVVRRHVAAQRLARTRAEADEHVVAANAGR